MNVHKNAKQIPGGSRAIGATRAEPAEPGARLQPTGGKIVDATNSSKSVWADRAYRSARNEAWLKAQGYRSDIHRNSRCPPLVLFEKIAKMQTKIVSENDIEGLIADMFRSPVKLLKHWVPDFSSESACAHEIAATNPDLLLPVVGALRNHCITKKLYPNHYDLVLSALTRIVADALADLFEPHPVQPGPMRVVIMVPWLHTTRPTNNILTLVAQYLAQLEQIPEITGLDLLVTNENNMGVPWYCRDVPNNASPGRRMHAEVFLKAGVKKTGIHYAPLPLQRRENAIWVRDFFRQTRPNIVFVPNVALTSYYVHGINKQSASIYMQTSLRNRPPYDFDRYLCKPQSLDDSHLHRERWHVFKSGYSNFGEQKDFGRKCIGVNDDDVLIITTSNWLQTEIDEEICEILFGVLHTHPRAKWMLLGATLKHMPTLRRKIQGIFSSWQSHSVMERVILQKFTLDIKRYLELSDIYVNPRRTGGGMSMALSIYGNTPVLSFQGNDATNFLLPEMVFDNPSDYGAKLSQLVSDRSSRLAVAGRQREALIQNHSMEVVTRKLTQHFRSILDAKTKC